MNSDHLHFPLDLAHIIAYVMMAIVIAYILGLSIVHGKSIIQGFRGKDMIWQFIEVAMLIWLIIFPSMMICDLFLGYHASERAWYGMEIIFVAAVSGKVGLSHLNKNKSSEINDEQG